MNSEKVYRVGIFKGVGDLSFSGSATITPDSAAAAAASSGGGGGGAVDPAAAKAAVQAALAAKCQADCTKLSVLHGVAASNTCFASCPPATLPQTISSSIISSFLSRFTSAAPSPAVVSTRTASSYVAVPAPSKMPSNKKASDYASSSSQNLVSRKLITIPSSEAAPTPDEDFTPPADYTIYYVIGAVAVLGTIAYLSMKKG